MHFRWLCVATVALSGCEQAAREGSSDAPLWTMDAQPQIVIGGDERSEPLYRVTGVAAIAEGYFVVNAGAYELRVYDNRGELVHRTGREGSGPGEFQSPRLVGRLPGDSLVIFDKPLNRTSIVCGGRQICDSWESPVTLGSVIGIHSDRVLFERMLPNAAIEGETHDTHTFAIAQRGADDAEFSVELRGRTRMAKRMGGPPLISMPVPFTQSPHAALTPTGIVLVDGPTGKIRVNSMAGTDSVMTIHAPLPVDPARFRQVIDALIAEAPPGRQAMLRSVYNDMSPPETRSVVRNLLVDRLGMIWLNVERSEPDDPEWLIIDFAGNTVGRVRTPPGLVIHEVGEDYVLGVWRDELDVESVRQYFLKR